MKKRSFLSAFFVLFVCLLMGSVNSAEAQLLVEDFNYTNGQLITANGWTAHSAGGTNAITVTSPGLTYSGYPSSGVGNAVSLTTSGEDDNRTYAVQSAGSVYAALMVNISDAAIDASGGYFFHLGPDPISTTFRGRLYIKKDASNNIAFGITKAGATLPGDIAFTGFAYSLNTTYLLVIKYTVVAGATNDTVSLFVNPTLPGSEPGSPTVTAPDVAASDINPGSVALRQGSATTSPTVKVDGIRIGTTWESVAGAATIPDSNVDFNHDGKTDYVVVRGTGSPLTGSLTDGAPKAFTNYRDRRGAQLQNAKNATSVAQAYWYTLINGTGEGSVTPWGDADQDVLVPQDFDGDGKDDIAVWRPGDPGAFYIIYSSTNTGAVFFLGSTFDDPTVSGDYDHDGKADPAVYSCPDPSGPAGNCFFRYIGSNNNPGQTVTEVFWGVGVALEFAPAPGDYDGDGKYDFCIRRENPGVPGQAQYALMRSSDFGQEQIDWGLMTDLNEPGDYDGDHKADFMVARNDSGNLNHYLLTRTGNFSVMQWGIANDIPTPGDYDGDGKSDVSVYRLGAMPANSTFYSISLTQGFIDAIEWGTCLAPCDTPAANWNVQ